MAEKKKKKKFGNSSSGGSIMARFKLRTSNKRKLKKKKRKRIQDSSGSDNSNPSGGSLSSDSSNLKRKKEVSTDKVSLGKIKSTLSVGKTERNALRNRNRDISYAYTVNTSRLARKDDAGVSIKSTLYKQGGERKLQIRKIDFDDASKLKDTINAINDMDKAGGGNNEPLKKIEIDLDGVADVGKLKDALKELDASIKIEFKFKDRDRNRPYDLDEGFGGLQKFIEAAKGRPKKNDNITAIENLASEAQQLQSKASPTKEDMNEIVRLKDQINDLVSQAESEMKGKAEENFLNSVKLALALESDRVTKQKATIDAIPPPKPKAKDLLVAAAEIRANKAFQKTLSIDKIEQNKLRNLGREIDYAYKINTNKDAQNNDTGVNLQTTLFKKEEKKILQIHEIDFDDPTKFKLAIDAISNLDKSALSKIEIDLGGVSDLSKLRVALQEIDPKIEIEFKFKDRDKNRPYGVEGDMEGVQQFIKAAKGKPKKNDNLDAIETLVEEARIIKLSDSLSKEDNDKLLYINQQIDGFMKRAEGEMNGDAESRFLEGVKLLLGIEKDKLVLGKDDSSNNDNRVNKKLKQDEDDEKEDTELEENDIEDDENQEEDSRKEEF